MVKLFLEFVREDYLKVIPFLPERSLSNPRLPTNQSQRFTFRHPPFPTSPVKRNSTIDSSLHLSSIAAENKDDCRARGRPSHSLASGNHISSV